MNNFFFILFLSCGLQAINDASTQLIVKVIRRKNDPRRYKLPEFSWEQAVVNELANSCMLLPCNYLTVKTRLKQQFAQENISLDSQDHYRLIHRMYKKVRYRQDPNYREAAKGYNIICISKKRIVDGYYATHDNSIN